MTAFDPSQPTSSERSHAGVPVGDYAGLRAGEAIADVRRLGLRPALERAESPDPRAHGFVVGQDPSAGEAVAIDGVVALRVAAPPSISADPAAETDEPPYLDAEEAQAQGGELEDDLDIDEWWAGGGYEDDTVAVHELAEPDEREEAPLVGEAFRAEEDAQYGARASRWTAVDELRAGAFVVWWRSLPRALRRGALGVIALAAVVLLASLGGRAGPARSGSVRAPGLGVGSHAQTLRGARVAGQRGRARASGARPVVRRVVVVHVVYVTRSISAPVREPAAPSTPRTEGGRPPARGAVAEFGLP